MSNETNRDETKREETPCLEVLERIDSVCIDFEVALRAGGSPKIEDLLVLAPDGARDQLLRELLALELDYRFPHRKPDPTDYYERFPEDRRVIDAVCEQLKEYRQHALASVPTAAERIEPEGVGAVVGRYKLLQKIGEGGMGTVYMAEQQQPVRRKVALKIIKPGMHSGEVVARFEAERQALALMEHQNIAKVLDAGTTDNGRPFFVMELVRGVPITKYCDDNRLNIAERLGLFEVVCQAIQHAHQKGIIHRDIKPSNVLVCNYDGKPVPKVIDFGIAKAIQQRLTEKTLFTRFGQMVGTPAYMSPEQAEMNQLDIDTRSDVYSLGVLLYELLTGDTPITGEQLRAAGWEGMIRLIREQEPPKPSARLSTSGEALPSISAQRRTEPKTLGSLIRGDLDWIVMKALEKDRTRRYATANGFARDIERHLADEPVEACPPSVAYKARKFMRKHRVGILIASVFASLLVGVVLAGLGIRHAVVTDRQRILTANAQKIAAQNLENDRQRARSLVESLLTARAAGVPFAIIALEPLQEHAVPILRSKYDAENIDPTQRLHAACALAEFEDVRLQFLVDSVQQASADEVANIAAALRHAQEDAAKQLNGLFKEEEEPAARARWATVLLHLGDTGAAQIMLALGPDPNERTVFIHGLDQWHGDLSDYAQPLRATKDAAFRSGLCLAIGRIPVDEFGAKEKQQLEQVLLELYRTAPDSSTHSASDWTLRQWRVELPWITPSMQVPRERDWYVNTLGLTMVKIPAGNFVREDIRNPSRPKQEVTLTRAFWMSNREVSVDQFQQFMKDGSAEEKPTNWAGNNTTNSPSGAHPVNSVDWPDAVLFCNWLSDQDSLPRCYERSETAWHLLPDASGYRLPNDAEWEYACRAQTTTEFCFGNYDDALLDHYAVNINPVPNFALELMQTCGSKLPNGWGMFDMHGNAWEWSYTDTNVGSSPGPSSRNGPALHAASFCRPEMFMRSADRGGGGGTRSSYTGFRVAKTYP